MPIKSLIRAIPDYPAPGIMFRDITTLLKDPQGLALTTAAFVERYKDLNISKVAGIEARGFMFGTVLAHALGAGFIPVRKKGKLPAAVIGHDYALEYGTDRIEIHVDAIAPGERVLLIDDLIATGGTAEAACKLISTVGGVVVECAFVIDLPELGGRKRLEAAGQKVFALCEFEGH
jgi:adenine phosphoribosyltransferase